MKTAQRIEYDDGLVTSGAMEVFKSDEYLDC
jgi:hypothetical protein